MNVQRFAAFAGVFLTLNTPIYAQETSSSTALAAIKEGRNGCKTLVTQPDFWDIMKVIGTMYEENDLAFPAHEYIIITTKGEQVWKVLSNEQISTLLSSLAIWRDCAFYARDRFILSIKLLREDLTLFAESDVDGNIMVHRP